MAACFPRPRRALDPRQVLPCLAWPVAACCLLPGLAAAAAVTAPAARAQVVHVVEPGQTLFRIAQAYGASLATLVQANHLGSANAIAVGQQLIIPGARAPAIVPARRPLSDAERRDLERSLGDDRAPATPPVGWAPPAPRAPGEFVWPLQGPVTSPFGARGGRRHAGIDIGSLRLQGVVAAADGEVAFAQTTGGGFGNVLVLDHEGGFSTVYAHLAVLIAREGESARQGQPIGGVGATGNASGPHLHFEIRHRGIPLDPLRSLPRTLDDLLDDLARRRR